MRRETLDPDIALAWPVKEIIVLVFAQHDQPYIIDLLI
jgi:hypothetical protein